MELERFEDLVDRDIHGELTHRETAELDAACLANPALRRLREQDRRLAALMRAQGPNRAPSNLASMIMDQIEAEAPTRYGMPAATNLRPAREAQPAAPRERAPQTAGSAPGGSQASPARPPQRVEPRIDPAAQPLAPEQRLRLDWEPAARGRRARKSGGGVFAFFTSSGFRWGFATAVLGVICYQAYVVFRQPLSSRSQLFSENDESLGDLTPVEMESETASERGLADRLIASAPSRNQFSRESLQVPDENEDVAESEAKDSAKLEATDAAAVPPDAERLDANEARRGETQVVEPEEGMRKIKKSSESEPAEIEVARASSDGGVTEPAETADASGSDTASEEIKPETEVAAAAAEAPSAVSAPTPAEGEAAADKKAATEEETMVAQAAEPTAEPTPAKSDEEIQAAAREREIAAAEEARIAKEAEDARRALERRLAEAEAERDQLRTKLQEEEIASAAKAVSEPLDDVSRQIEELRANLSRVTKGEPIQGAKDTAAGAAAPAPIEIKSPAPAAPSAEPVVQAAAPAESAGGPGRQMTIPVVALNEPAAEAPKAEPSMNDGAVASAAAEPRRRNPITLKTPTVSDAAMSLAAEASRADVEIARARTVTDRPAEAAALAAESPAAAPVSAADQLRKELEARRSGRQPIQISGAQGGGEGPTPEPAAQGSEAERLRQALESGQRSVSPQAPGAEAAMKPAPGGAEAGPTPVDPEIINRARRELERREREPMERQGERELAAAERAAREPVTMRARGSAPPVDLDRDRRSMRAGSGREAGEKQITPTSTQPNQGRSGRGRLQEVEIAIASNGGTILRRVTDPSRPGAYTIKVKVKRERLGDLSRALEKSGVRQGKGASRYDITDEQGSTAELTVRLAPE